MVVIANIDNGERDWIYVPNGVSISHYEYIQALSIYSMIEQFTSPWENEEALVFKIL